MGKAANIGTSRYYDASALLSLLDLNNNSSLLVVVSSLFALWLLIYLFPQKEEKEKGGEDRVGKDELEWRLVETVEGFDIQSFVEVLRAAKFRVLTIGEEPLPLRHLTLNEGNQLTYREEKKTALDDHEKHPQHHASALKEVKLQGDTVKLVFIEGDDMVFRCQGAEETSQISEGLASLVSALANNPALLTRELDSPLKQALDGIGAVAGIINPVNWWNASSEGETGSH